MLNNPYAIGEAMTAQVLCLAEQAKTSAAATPAQREVIYSVATRAAEALDAGRNAMATGDFEAALFSLGAAEGALTLICALSQTPDDQLVQELAAPFRGIPV